MISDLRYGIGLFLPTALLLGSGNLLPTETKQVHRELFGSNDYFLDVQYPAFKKRRTGAQQIPIKGFFATKVKEEPIKGYVYKTAGGWRISFDFAGGHFSGTWSQNPSHCEPELRFQVVKYPTPSLEKGVLRGGFCEENFG
jgi:hypothetical protein